MKKSNQSKKDAQRFPWRATIICGVIIALMGWWVQDYIQRRQREKDVAVSVGISVANDLRTSAGVSEGMRENLKKKQFDLPAGFFAAIYSPKVDVPAAIDTMILKPSVLSALDEYRRTLGECAKHRDRLIAEKEKGAPQFMLKGLLLVYCIGLDSVVKSGLQLLQSLESEYPTVKEVVTKPPSYRPIENDMPEILKVLKDATP